MALRYWVGGSGTWDATATIHWSDTSGGAAGFSAPTSVDDVYLDANSGAAGTIVIVNSGRTVKSLTCTGYIGQLTGGMNVAGNLTFGSGMILAGGQTSWVMTATGTITTAGKNFPRL